MMVKDEWVRTAMTDDNVVVEFLVRLKQAQAAPEPAVVALKWGIRQPRSKAGMSMRCVDAKGDGDSNISTRLSPTTPLSWSGGDVSPSAADGYEETSREVFRSTTAATSRSKGGILSSVTRVLSNIVGLPFPSLSVTVLAVACVIAGIAAHETISTTNKRSRKKKTFAELKEEENLLLKERISLKKEIASMLATFEEKRAKNENLKRFKLDLNSSTANNTSSMADQPLGSSLCSHTLDDRKAMLGCCTEGKALPFDLNTMPFGDDFGTS